MANLKGSKTMENLMRAFAGESQARNRYTFGADLAKKQNLYVLQELFTYTADQERAHADVFFDHLKELTGEEITIDNGSYPVTVYDKIEDVLKAAEKAEYHEHDTVYKEFAKVAKEEGFAPIASSFEKIASIEKVHGDRFKEYAEAVATGSLFKKTTEQKWLCLNCGYIYEGKEAPQKCPVCHYPQGYYMLFTKSYFE